MKHSLDKRRRPQRRPVAFEMLEPRLLLSADLVPALAPLAHDALPPIPAEHRSLEAMAEFPRVVMTQEAARAREVVFVDARLPDYERLVADVLRATGGERPVDVILLDPSRDGVAQMTEALATRTGVAAVHLVTHGGDGRLQLGNTTLDAAALEANSDAIAAWSRAFAADGDLLLYGCNVAATPRGEAFIDAIALLTGADVAASDDFTGAARLGGDWDLERTTGVIDTPIGFSSELVSWGGVLAQLDWDDAAVDWPATGLGPTSFAVGGGNVTITIADPAGRLNNGSPDDTTNDQGGLALTEQGLYVSSTGFLFGESAVITIDFSHPGGVSNVSFTIFDLDRGGGPNFVDEVLASYTASGVVTLGITTSANNTLIAPDTVRGTQPTTSNGPNSDDANATFTFTGTGITQIQLSYRNAGGATNQSITLHDINFTTNSPPSGTNGTVIAAEDTAHTLAAGDFGFTDPDAGDALSAVRIDTLPGAGTLRLSGVGVLAGQVITVADITAGNLVFTPAAAANGAPYASFTFSVRDSAGQFDQSPNTLTVNVTPVNDAPVASGSATLAAVAEDTASPGGATVAALFGGNYSDATDGAGATAFAGIAVTGNAATAAQGVWQYSPDGLAWTAIGTALSDASSVTLPATHLLRFLPAADFNGVPGGLTVRLADGSGGAVAVATGVNLGGAIGGTERWSAATVALGTTITAVNDAPTFGALGNQTVAEDAGAQTVASFTTVAPGGGADEAGQMFGYTVSNDNNGMFSVQPTIAANGTLTYTAAANAIGSATVSVFVTDSGGTANGGVDTTGPRTFTIGVTPVADTPAVTNATTLEDTQSNSGLVITRNAADGAEVTHYKITGIAGGTLFLNDGATAIANGTFITVAEGAAGLKFTSTPNSIGNGTFDVQASTAANDTGLGGSVVTATVVVTAVNDEPSFTLVGNQTALEDAGAQTIAAFATAAAGGGPDEAGQTFTYTVTNDNNALFAVQPSIAANGTLTFTPTGNLHGTATVTVFIADSGGVLNGGDDTASAQTFTITVTAVADAPTLTVNAAAGNEDTAIALTVARSLADTDGSETLALTVSAIPIGATLTDGANTFTASAGNQSVAITTWNLATLTVTPPANSDVDFALSVSATATEAANGATAANTGNVAVDVVPVNDAPVLGPVSLSLDPLQTVTMSSANMSATDVDNPAASLVFLVAGATNGNFELVSAPGVPVTSFTQAQLTAGQVRFVHTNAGFGPSFSIFVSDGAAIAGPGVAVVSFRGQGAEPPDLKREMPASTNVQTESGVLATGRVGLAEPSASDFLRGPLAGAPSPAVNFAEAPAETLLALAKPVRGGSILDQRASGAPSAGFVEAERIPTDLPKMDFAINPVRHDDAPHTIDLAFGSARITGMALSVGAVWWAARAGGLLASLLASTPAWRHVDPLPVLGRDETEPEIDWDTPEKSPPDEDPSEAQVFGEARAANDPR